MVHRHTAPCAPLVILAASLTLTSHARAQTPPVYPQQPLPPQGYPQQQPPQGYPQQPLPQQPPPPAYPQQPPPQQGYPQQQPPPQQGYPQQQQPLPPQGYPQQQQQPQGYLQPQPPQGYPQQPLPPQGYPQQPLPPQGYPPPPQGYAPQPGAMPPPGYPPQPLAPPVASDLRDPGELAALYGASIAYGVGSGIWLDGLGHVSDPGIAFIAPIALGAAAPIGVYLWDSYEPFHRGVPASISTGLGLGAVEGIAIAGTQWQHSDRGGPNTWSFATQSSVTWLLATGGGIGGYAFGEWLRPDPRSLAFIASGAGWGAISGSFIGAAAGSGDWKNGSSIGGLVGYNAGIVGAGALSIYGYVPSWRTQQAMWLGYLLGTAAASVVYLFYIGSNDDPRHGLVANALGGLAGIGVAAALTANMKDPDQASSWLPPFQVGITPTPNGGAALSAYGMF